MISALEVLGLREGASREEIQDAFRRLSLRVHPDVCLAGAGLFRVLCEARDAAMGSSSLPWSTAWNQSTPPPLTTFQWFRAQPGLIQCGTPDGMLAVVRVLNGAWFWSIPGGHESYPDTWADPGDARAAAEVAYQKFFAKGS